MTVLPHVSPLFRDYLAMGDTPADSPLRRWFGAEPYSGKWMRPSGATRPTAANLATLADLLDQQNNAFGASPAAHANIAKLKAGAQAVVTGQQVALFGGPLLTLLKAATAVARAKAATTATGVEHVPIFWMATEDHDLAEVDQVSLLTKTSVEKLRANLRLPHPVPVGGVALGPEHDAELDALLERATELLEFAPIADTLRECYRPASGEPVTLGLAFGRLIARIFADHGLIVMDAAPRAFHALGASTLRYAIQHADTLHQALIARSEELVTDGYHAQVLVAETTSLLFLLDETTGERLALRRPAQSNDRNDQRNDQWKAGSRLYSTAELLAILDATPERLSPNALLRPIFQDTLLPTAAYIGGPSEIAYFAQSEVLYRAILGRVTPILPRLSATLLEPAIATVMAKDDVQLPDALTTPEALAQRLGARAMPIEGKRKLAAVGNALDQELSALQSYLAALDETLGRSAEVSGSKMLYQMNRLRRMAATFELQKNASLRKHADAITLNVFPNEHPQERVIAGVWYMARYGEGLIDRLVTVAGNQCPSHVVVTL